MTEYDYSPAAYERHIATKTRISSWVSSQSSHTRSYSNPFTPPPPEPKSRKSTSRSRSSTLTSQTATPTRKAPVRSHTTQEISGRSSAEQSRHHTPSRSRTMPPGQILQPQPKYANMPLSHAALLSGSQQQQKDPYHYRSRSSHYYDRSRAKSPPTSTPHLYHQSHTSRSSIPYTTDRDASGRKIIQLNRTSSNRVVHIPVPRDDGQYVIVPPPGGTVEVLSPDDLHEQEHRGYEREEREERERNRITVPFFKRWFSGLTGGSGGESNRDSSPKSKPKYSSSGHHRRKSF